MQQSTVVGNFQSFCHCQCPDWQTVPCLVDNARTVYLSLCACIRRKRKSPEADVRPRIVRMTWDVDAESTSAIMKDVGVSLLTSEQTDKHWTAVSSHSAAELLQPRVSY